MSAEARTILWYARHLREVHADDLPPSPRNGAAFRHLTQARFVRRNGWAVEGGAAW